MNGFYWVGLMFVTSLVGAFFGIELAIRNAKNKLDKD